VIDCSTWGSCSFWAWHPRPAPPLDLHALHRHRHRGICMCSRRSLAQPPGTRCWRQRAPPPASSRPLTAPAVCFVTSPLFAALTCCLVSRRRRDISNFSLVLVPTARLPALPPSTARLPALYLSRPLPRPPLVVPLPGIFCMPFNATHTFWQLSFRMPLEADARLMKGRCLTLKAEALSRCRAWHGSRCVPVVLSRRLGLVCLWVCLCLCLCVCGCCMYIVY